MIGSRPSPGRGEARRLARLDFNRPRGIHERPAFRPVAPLDRPRVRALAASRARPDRRGVAFAALVPPGGPARDLGDLDGRAAAAPGRGGDGGPAGAGRGGPEVGDPVLALGGSEPPRHVGPQAVGPRRGPWAVRDDPDAAAGRAVLRAPAAAGGDRRQADRDPLDGLLGQQPHADHDAGGQPAGPTHRRRPRRRRLSLDGLGGGQVPRPGRPDAAGLRRPGRQLEGRRLGRGQPGPGVPAGVGERPGRPVRPADGPDGRPPRRPRGAPPRVRRDAHLVRGERRDGPTRRLQPPGGRDDHLGQGPRGVRGRQGGPPPARLLRPRQPRREGPAGAPAGRGRGAVRAGQRRLGLLRPPRRQRGLEGDREGADADPAPRRPGAGHARHGPRAARAARRHARDHDGRVRPLARSSTATPGATTGPT